MSQVFPRKANNLPHLSLIGVLLSGVASVAFVWYYFSPEYTDVGYAPEQPVPYSHRLHVDQLGMDCRYCHSAVETADIANIPSTQTCMNCHGTVLPQSVDLLPVHESWSSGESVPWVKVHTLPDYVQFSHAAHVSVGVGCESCHGRVDQMEVVRLEEPLSMGWCLECHREPEQYLRPPSEVTTMGFIHASDYVSRNLDRIAAESILPPTTCSACHY